MRANALRHKVKIQTMAPSTSAFGTDPNKETPTTIATRRASIRPMTGEELYRAQQFHAEVSTQIVMRYDDLLATLSPKHRIVNANSTGRVYDVLSAINMEERDREIRVLAKERV